MKKRMLALLLAIVTLCPIFAACSDHYDYDSYLDYIVLGDTAELSINQTDLDDEVLSSFYSYYDDEIEAETLTSVELTSGTVKFGDTVNIDYNGYLFGETSTFEGGSTYTNGEPKGTDLEIGSGTYIEGFESGLIGYEVGDTVYLNLYFPDDYKTTTLAGKQVRFEVKINKISKRYDYPEMNDDNVKTQSKGTYNTVEEFKAAIIENTKKNLIWEAYYNLCKVKEFPETELKEYYNSTLDTHKYYATAWYGGNMDSYASAMGYTNASTFYSNIAQQAAQQVKQDLMVLAVVEANNLALDEATMNTKLKELYDAQVAAGSYDGRYRSFEKEYGRKALEIEVYTDVVIEFLLGKTTIVDNTKYTGVKGSANTGIKFYKDDVQQTGWVSFDINKDGTEEKFYFDATTGLAYENVAACVPVENGSDTKYYKFGRFGMLENVVDKVVESDGKGLIYAIDGVAQSGLISIEKDGRIDGTELYYFDPETKHMLLGVHKLTFGAKNGLYYNFGETGIYNINDETGEAINDLSTIDPSNGLADGLLENRYFDNGNLLTGRYTIEEYEYYFDPDDEGNMLKEDFFTVDGDKYYCDADGHIVKSSSQTIGNTVYTFDATGKITAEEPFTGE